MFSVKRLVGPFVFAAAVLSSPLARAQPVPPVPSPVPGASAGVAPTPTSVAPRVLASSAPPAGTDIVPGSLSGAARSTPLPLPAATSPAGSSAAPSPPAQPISSPAPAVSPGGARVHLDRPGTDVAGDVLTGNGASDVYVVRGNVVLHSDPKVDREFASTESDEPITITADEIAMDRAGLTYIAKGKVHFVQGTRSGDSDVAMLNEQTRDLDLLGNADVHDGDRRLRAAKMHYNFGDRTFRGAGDVRIYQPLPTPGPRASTAPPKRRRRLPL